MSSRLKRPPLRGKLVNGPLSAKAFTILGMVICGACILIGLFVVSLGTKTTESAPLLPWGWGLVVLGPLVLFVFLALIVARGVDAIERNATDRSGDA